MYIFLQLVLVAADHGSPTAYETLRLLTVQLVDTNDNVPQFYEEYNFHVSENRPKDYFIGKVTAEDKDEGRHAKVYYYIEAGNYVKDIQNLWNHTFFLVISSYNFLTVIF